MSPLLLFWSTFGWLRHPLTLFARVFSVGSCPFGTSFPKRGIFYINVLGMLVDGFAAGTQMQFSPFAAHQADVQQAVPQEQAFEIG